MADDRDAQIRQHAYRLWQQEGEPHGRDREHWERAERELAGDAPADPKPAGSPAGDPHVDAGAAAAQVGSDDAEAPAPAVTSTPAPPTPPASSAPPAKGPAKKPATRRKRTT